VTQDPFAAVLHGAHDLRWEPRPIGRLAPDRVRVLFGAGGICGSDLAYVAHGRSGDFLLRTPLVLGHELAGTIVEVGEGVTGRAVGKRVAINPARWCGTCARCRERRPNLCENVYFMGSASKTPHMQGGFVERFDVDPSQCFAVPEDTPLSDAALAEPLAVALHAVSRGPSLAGANVAVFGGGPIGLLILLVARRAGAASVGVVDVAERPLRAASELGADVVVNAAQEALAQLADVDVVFEASGSASGWRGAATVVRRGGALVQVGNLSAGDVTVPLNVVMAKELDVAGSFRYGNEFAEAVEAIASGSIAVGRIVRERRPLADVVGAFALAADPGRSGKIVLVGEGA
jgi:L-idonate 5-dehydrogenase